jgi:hypothetical protein
MTTPEKPNIPQEIESIATAAEAEARALYARRPPNYVLALILVALAFVFGLAFAASRANARVDAAQAATKQLVVIAAQQDSVIHRDSITRDSLVANAAADRAQLVAAANAASARATIHLRFGPNAGTHSEPHGAPGAVVPDSQMHPDTTQRLLSIDSTWHTIYVNDDSLTPHYVDGTIADILHVLVNMQVEYAEFRDSALTTVNADAAALAQDSASIADLNARLVTAQTEVKATRAMIPGRASRWWHDVKVAGVTLAGAGAVKLALSLLHP